MTPTLIICITVIIILSMITFVVHGVVHKHLEYKRGVYRDMDVLLTKAIVAMDRTLDRLVEKPVEINEEVQEEVHHLADKLDNIYDKVEDISSMKDEIKDLQGKMSVNSVGKAFTPRRRG